ncbi:MAG: hypothetical protein WAT79_03715 [Saprospiraceae bacterium]
MNTEKVIQDLTSKESQRIRESGLVVIQNSQNEKAIESLVPYLNQIKQSTNELKLGGAFASNDRFYKFPIEIIEFYKDKKSIWNRNSKCSCCLYLSKSYENYNPEKEAGNESIKLNAKLKGNYTQDYSLQCLKCNLNYYVSERHYHYVWWHWEKLEDYNNIIDSGNSSIDYEFKLLLKSVKDAIKPKDYPKKALNFEKERIMDFRYKLAYNKGTEHYEVKYEWNKIMDKLIEEINIRINNEA